MKQNLLPKLFAAILLGSSIGWYSHHYYVKWNLRGRDAFIAYETHRYELFVASPGPLFNSLVFWALIALGICVLYELLVEGLSSIVNRFSGKTVEKGIR
ncbi:MAG TPA: hypothetical protein VMH89_00685 [Candidatus Acidoferrum sp.]|nr:hypothetical protein [Candidatus Acidoferrum sp.]